MNSDPKYIVRWLNEGEVIAGMGYRYKSYDYLNDADEWATLVGGTVYKKWEGS